jgi:hypothetical protein
MANRVYRGAKVRTVPRGAKVKTSVNRVQLLPGAIAVSYKEHSGKGAERVYVYTDQSAGATMILAMKALAKAGAGLNRFVNFHQPRYDRNPELFTGDYINQTNYTANPEQITSGSLSNQTGWWTYLGD